MDVLLVVACELGLRYGRIFGSASALGWSATRGIKEVVLLQGSASKSRGVSCGIFINQMHSGRVVMSLRLTTLQLDSRTFPASA